jgi:ABC-2 type transport system permease protein
MNQAWAILWVQVRSTLNVYRKASVAWTTIAGSLWYGLWLFGAYAAGSAMAEGENLTLISNALPGGLFLAFLYWQVMPLMMAATGASLDLRKLLAYPIPISQFFFIEVLLRATAAAEMVMITIAVGIGVLLNPGLPFWGALGAVVFIAFNLALAVGIRDVVGRLLAHKHVREIAFFFLILLVALPQIALRNLGPGDPRGRFSRFSASTTWQGWPWTAAAQFMQGHNTLRSAAVLLAWSVGAYLFARWQFGRTLKFDAQAAEAGGSKPRTRSNLMEYFYRLPNLVFRDPLGALIEKEIRFLTRSPRFRLVFLMGFTFGLMIWLPLAFGGSGGAQSVLGGNYLTAVSVYSILLLSEVSFWNSFGFDRIAAQVYFLAPVRFSQVLIAKNITAMFFISVEIAVVSTICALLRMPVSVQALVEAYSVGLVVSVLLLSAGNILSVRQARGVDPSKSFRSGAAGRVQAVLLLIYPVAFTPVALAYLARYAFDSQLAFFAVLAFDLTIGLVFYKIALESAVSTAEQTREEMISRLSQGAGPIAA